MCAFTGSPTSVKWNLSYLVCCLVCAFFVFYCFSLLSPLLLLCVSFFLKKKKIFFFSAFAPAPDARGRRKTSHRPSAVVPPPAVLSLSPRRRSESTAVPRSCLFGVIHTVELENQNTHTRAAQAFTRVHVRTLNTACFFYELFRLFS